MGFNLRTIIAPTVRDPRLLAELARGFLRGVVAANRAEMRAAVSRGRPFPRLYESGVRYEREPWSPRIEEFADVATVLRRGWGDCDDLCAWRVAELQELGEAADIRLYWRRNKRGQFTMHVQVRRANGDIEDPSRFLGL
jgi:hypothetical protein